MYELSYEQNSEQKLHNAKSRYIESATFAINIKTKKIKDFKKIKHFQLSGLSTSFKMSKWKSITYDER